MGIKTQNVTITKMEHCKNILNESSWLISGSRVQVQKVIRTQTKKRVRFNFVNETFSTFLIFCFVFISFVPNQSPTQSNGALNWLSSWYRKIFRKKQSVYQTKSNITSIWLSGCQTVQLHDEYTAQTEEIKSQWSILQLYLMYDDDVMYCVWAFIFNAFHWQLFVFS